MSGLGVMARMVGGQRKGEDDSSGTKTGHAGSE